jgi:hypothetical protein
MSVKLSLSIINEKRTAEVEDQVLEVARAVLMGLEEVGEREVMVPGLVEIQALLLNHLHIDLEGEADLVDFVSLSIFGLFRSQEGDLVPPAASGLLPKRIIRVRTRYAE